MAESKKKQEAAAAEAKAAEEAKQKAEQEAAQAAEKEAAEKAEKEAAEAAALLEASKQKAEKTPAAEGEQPAEVEYDIDGNPIMPDETEGGGAQNEPQHKKKVKVRADLKALIGVEDDELDEETLFDKIKTIGEENLTLHAGLSARENYDKDPNVIQVKDLLKKSDEELVKLAIKGRLLQDNYPPEKIDSLVENEYDEMDSEKVEVEAYRHRSTLKKVQETIREQYNEKEKEALAKKRTEKQKDADFEQQAADILAKSDTFYGINLKNAKDAKKKDEFLAPAREGIKSGDFKKFLNDPAQLVEAYVALKNKDSIAKRYETIGMNKARISKPTSPTVVASSGTVRNTVIQGGESKPGTTTEKAAKGNWFGTAGTKPATA